jgi:hypothetical protein
MVFQSPGPSLLDSLLARARKPDLIANHNGHRVRPDVIYDRPRMLQLCGQIHQFFEREVHGLNPHVAQVAKDSKHSQQPQDDHDDDHDVENLFDLWVERYIRIYEPQQNPDDDERDDDSD